jgi:hypothetical protein
LKLPTGLLFWYLAPGVSVSPPQLNLRNITSKGEYIYCSLVLLLNLIAAEGSLLFFTLCIHSPQSFARVMYCQNVDLRRMSIIEILDINNIYYFYDVCPKYSGIEGNILCSKDVFIF